MRIATSHPRHREFQSTANFPNDGQRALVVLGPFVASGGPARVLEMTGDQGCWRASHDMRLIGIVIQLMMTLEGILLAGLGPDFPAFNEPTPRETTSYPRVDHKWVGHDAEGCPNSPFLKGHNVIDTQNGSAQFVVDLAMHDWS
jgi:hypothetical protein